MVHALMEQLNGTRCASCAEVDLVAHSGPVTRGSFVQTLVVCERTASTPSRPISRLATEMFVAGDRSPQRLGMTLRLLGAHLKTGQLAQQGAGMTEACLPRRDAHHAPHRRRQRGVLKS